MQEKRVLLKCVKKNTSVFFRIPCQPSSVSHTNFWVNFLFFLQFQWVRKTQEYGTVPVHTYRKLCVSSFKCTAQIFKIFFCLEVTGLYNVARQFFLRINNFFMSTIEDKWKNILKILYVHFLEETKSFLLVFLNLVCDIP